MEQVEKVTPEKTALRSNLVRYELSSAQERADRDLFFATCRDSLHAALQEVGPIDPKKIHEVIDAIDDFLNRAGGRRK